ncbi:MAG: helix-turn-helix transcriptional regulator [Oscillospiraceae bacterium]|nr:helix-turn-helix transcriptional regulator [Oscillospiraceae bacterium]
MYNRIKDLREDNNYKQREIAEVLSISRSAYANYERGIRDITEQVLQKLADFYHTSVDYLLFRTDIKEPYPESEKLKALKKLDEK